MYLPLSLQAIRGHALTYAFPNITKDVAQSVYTVYQSKAWHIVGPQAGSVNSVYGVSLVGIVTMSTIPAIPKLHATTLTYKSISTTSFAPQCSANMLPNQKLHMQTNNVYAALNANGFICRRCVQQWRHASSMYSYYRRRQYSYRAFHTPDRPPPTTSWKDTSF